VKRVERRVRASDDIDEAVAHYIEVASADVAERFLLEYEGAVEHIARHPGTGSRRYVQVLDGAELRFWTLNRFPYAVFYVERADVIGVVRVLHQASDIPAQLEN
jgi:toxin ParE1/3/4